MNIRPQINPPYYRYFNQPIELMPGWSRMKVQMVGHAKNSGLQWINTTDCSCCDWDGNGGLIFDIMCNGQKLWKSIPLTWTKISNYQWVYNGPVPGCTNENLNWEITCNSALPTTNCSSKWISTISNYPCHIPPYNSIIITSSNINTFGFSPEIIQYIQSLPYWPNPCTCDTPPIWYLSAQRVPDCGCCP